MTAFVDLTLNREPIAQQVFDALRAAIVTKQLPPGSPVSETGLAKLLGVSKSPVREAVLRLREISLLEGQGRSLRVLTPSAQSIRYAYELRAALETQAAWCAAQRANGAQATDLIEVAQQSLTACRNGQSAEFRRTDFAFHRKMADYSLNPLLAQHTQDAITLVNTLRSRDASDTPVSEACAEQHVAIAHAIRDHDSRAAASMTQEHVEAARKRILKDFNRHAVAQSSQPANPTINAILDSMRTRTEQE